MPGYLLPVPGYFLPVPGYFLPIRCQVVFRMERHYLLDIVRENIYPVHMRLPRCKSDDSAHYHCLSRIVGQQRLLGQREKEFFAELVPRVAAFHGIRILTYCILSNHFHLLLETPDPLTSAALQRDEILRRVAALYGKDGADALNAELERAAASSHPQREQEILDRYRSQMGDLSSFMKQLKQRFSIWFNRRHARKGTLWEDRFTSVLVEGNEQALLTVAAYIDLNALRAGIVERVEEYRWCGYAAAVAGDTRARAGLGRIFDLAPRVCGQNHAEDWEKTGASYRLLLYGEGEIREFVGPDARPLRPGFTREQVEAEIERGGKLPLPQLLRLRVRYLTAGVVLGSEAFVEDFFERNRSRFGKRRTTGARTMKGADWGDLRVFHDLREKVFG